MMHDTLRTASDPAEYYPTLFIGLGGSGMKAVRTILLYGTQIRSDVPAFDESLRQAIDNGRVVGLGIDTDSSEFSGVRVNREVFPDALAPHFDAGVFPDHYPEVMRRVVASRGDINNAIRAARHLGRWMTDEDRELRADNLRPAQLVDSFLSVDRKLYDQLLPPGDESQDGAGQMRSLGRIAFLCALPDIYNVINQARNDIAPLCGKQRMRVVIFASLAGGTGSGMFLDMATLIRKILISDAIITGHFLLPEVFAKDSITERIWPNTYASLMELAQVARPQNDRTIEINYRRNDRDQKVFIRSGDAAIYNDLFLYDESAACLDHALTGQTLPGHRIEVASRAMADTALALSRRDLIEKNPNRQNLLVGRRNNTDVTRRLFHEAMATPWLPKPVTDLSEILDEMVFLELLDSPMKTLRDVPVGYDSEASKNSEELLTRLVAEKQTELQWENSDIAQRGDDELKESDLHLRVRDWRRSLDTQALEGQRLSRPRMRELMAERNLDLLARRLYRAHAADQSVNHIEFSIYDYFQVQARKFWLPFQQMVDELERLQEHQHRPSQERLKRLQDLHDKIASIIAEAKRRMNSDDPAVKRAACGTMNFEVTDVVRRNRSTLAMLYETSEHVRNEAVSKFRLGGAHGPLGGEFATLGLQFGTETRKAVDAGGMGYTEENLARHWAVEGKLDETLARYAAALHELQRQRSHYRSHELLLEDHFGVDITTHERRTERFDDVMSPVRRVVDEIYSVHYNFARLGGDAKRQISARHDFLATTLRNAHALALEGLEPPVYKQFFLRLKELIDENARTGQVRICASIAKALSETLLASQVDVATALPGQFEEEELKKRLHGISAFTKDLISMWFRMPEFEFSRYGGTAGINDLAFATQTAVFNQASAPGALHVKCATLAMAPPEHRIDDNSRTENQIRNAIHGLLQTQPILASRSSQQPVLLHEARYNAAYQLRYIERYRMNYEDLHTDERALYHVLPEGPDFPRLIEADPTERVAIRWECHEHKQPYEVSADVPYCPECEREYYRGSRPLAEITRQSARVPLPSLDEEGSLNKADPIPSHVEEAFLLGVPEPDRNQKYVQRLAEIGEEKPFTGRWDSLEPPKLTFPQVPTPDLDALEHVAREPYKLDGRFVRLSDKTNLFECFHCGFPIVNDLADPESGAHVTCPRCHRALSNCEDCSSTHFHYVAKKPSSDGMNTLECPHCETLRASDE